MTTHCTRWLCGFCWEEGISLNTRSCACSVKRTRQLGSSTCAEHTGKPCMTRLENEKQSKERPPRWKIDLCVCHRMIQVLARLPQLSNSASGSGLLGFHPFKLRHKILYISIVAASLKNRSHFRLRSSYFPKDSLSCETRSK